MFIKPQSSSAGPLPNISEPYATFKLSNWPPKAAPTAWADDSGSYGNIPLSQPGSDSIGGNSPIGSCNALARSPKSSKNGAREHISWICDGLARPSSNALRPEQKLSISSGVAQRVGFAGIISFAGNSLRKSLRPPLKSKGVRFPMLLKNLAIAAWFGKGCLYSGNSYSIMVSTISKKSELALPKNASASSRRVVLDETASANDIIFSWSANAAAPRPKEPNVCTSVSFTVPSSASSPQMDDANISASAVSWPIANAAEISAVVSKAWQMELPIVSHIFTSNFIKIVTIISLRASLTALKSILLISVISGIQPAGLTNFGKVISFMLLQNGNSKSFTNSKTEGSKGGGVWGQVIVAIVLAINWPPGNLLISSTKSRYSSSKTSIIAAAYASITISSLSPPGGLS